MPTRIFELLVRFCCRHAKAVLLLSMIASLIAGFYAFRHFNMDSNSENLISPDLPWRQRTVEFDAAFPQRNNLTLIVLDGVTPERTREAASALKTALAMHKNEFPVVRDIQGDPFFAHNGLLFLPLEDVRKTTQQIIAAQPFLAPLAADPSLRGIMDSLSTALLGVENGASTLNDLTQAFSTLSDTLEKTTKDQSAFFSWQRLVSGGPPSSNETRRLIELQGALDYGRLMPGDAASNLVRQLAADLHLTPEEGVKVRLTGPVPLRDEEFATLVDRVGLMTALMLSAVLLMLWLAVRSGKIIAAILSVLLAGLSFTTAAGLAVTGKFNVISIAFIPLFVGIGIDFGIQYSVRYRDTRYVLGDLDEALVRAGVIMGPSLTLAAFATAACFYSFMPTDYSGLAELGFIAGTGMIIALVLNTTMLPALLKLLSPQGEQKEIGFAWLAPVDHFLYQRRRIILVSAAVLSVFGLSLLSFLQFDADPLDLRSNKTESMATLLDLERNPQTSPNTLDVLAPSAAAAEDLARRLSQLPEVDRAMTLQSFIPDNQPQKLALIGDASLLLDTALNPFDVKPPPDMAETKASVTAVKERLGEIAGIDTTPAARSARRLAVVLGILEKGDQTIMARATAALIPSLQTLLAQLRAVLAPQPVGLNDLPANLKRDWVTSDGRARVQVFPKGNSKNHVILEKFATAVRVVAPHATGAPISTVESGRTIVHAFMVAGILSLSSIVVLLAISLRRLQDVVLTVLPLLLTGILTFASCVILDLPLNFANIIVLPLLFGFGVAFNIYYIMSWRTGGHGFLQSSLTRAVVLSALTTASGFGTLWLSSHPGTASLGELLIISLAWTLAMTLFFLPALLGSVTPR